MYAIKETQHPGFRSFRLKAKRLRNRLVVAPMSRVSATPDGIPTEIMKEYYSAFAYGGFSIVITEGIYTDNKFSKGYPNQPGLTDIEHVEGWSKIAASISEAGAIPIAQLMHAGALSQDLAVTKAPSTVQPAGKKMAEYGGGDGAYPLPLEMTKEDIADTVDGFIQTSMNAYKAGFAGIEIHAANGYLLDQFLTPDTNFRTDEYGGTVANRFRIIAEIIKGMRDALPSHFIVGLRLSEGKVNNLFYRWQEGPAMAKAILAEVNRTRPDYIHIASESGNWQRDCTYADGSSLTGLARQITGLPVIANGGLHRLAMSEHVLSLGHADLLAIGSAALADPEWPSKVAKGMEPLPFHSGLIKPSATIEHTNRMRNKLIREF